MEEISYFIPSDTLGVLEHICQEAADSQLSRRKRITAFNKAARLLKELGLVFLNKGEAIKAIGFGVNHLGHHGVIVTKGFIEVASGGNTAVGASK